MSKIIINHEIKSSSLKEMIKEKKAILKDGLITYNNDGINVGVKINNDSVFLTRENKDMKISLEFELNKSLVTKYIIKDIKTEVILKTVTKKLIIEKNKLLIEYDLYMNNEFSDSFEYSLEWRCL